MLFRRIELPLWGDNGSGKSTLLKSHTGKWKHHLWRVSGLLPKLDSVGYLDQPLSKPSGWKNFTRDNFWAHAESYHIQIRQHWVIFYFVAQKRSMPEYRSYRGGEKVRLSLAQIAAKTPGLWSLDEVTNNLDLENSSTTWSSVLQQYTLVQ